MQKTKFKKKRIFILSLISLLLFGFGYSIYDDGDDFELVKNLEIYHNIMKELRINYVENIDSRQIITLSIDRMLEDLDPYTVYYPESEIESIRMMSESQYIGIGITVDTFKNYFYITDIENKSSAHLEGLSIGDKIISINGISTKGKNLYDFQNLITGQANTNVTLTINRNNIEKEYILTRNNIELPVVSLVEKINDFGYIKLESFTEKSASEFKAAFLKLQKDNITGLIIDLRDNPGGLLDQAVKIVNLFIEKDKLVVISKGKSKNSNASYITQQNAVDTEIPIIVLVNGGSASASEIVAGTFQDYDRAIIIGSQTYGKGLVQRFFDVGYNSKIKITISKYYIPSGRCIQEINYSKNNTNNTTKNNEYKTKNGRVVYEGQGITPDIIIRSDTIPETIKELEDKFIMLEFVNEYYSKIDTSTIKKPENVSFEEKTIFINYLKTINFFKNSQEINKITLLKNSMINNEIIVNQLSTTEELILKELEKQIYTNFEIINILISKQIVKRKYLHLGEIKFSLSHDLEIKKAQFYLSNLQEYNTILNK